MGSNDETTAPTHHHTPSQSDSPTTTLDDVVEGAPTPLRGSPLQRSVGGGCSFEGSSSSSSNNSNLSSPSQELPSLDTEEERSSSLSDRGSECEQSQLEFHKGKERERGSEGAAGDSRTVSDNMEELLLIEGGNGGSVLGGESPRRELLVERKKSFFKFHLRLFSSRPPTDFPTQGGSQDDGAILNNKMLLLAPPTAGNHRLPPSSLSKSSSESNIPMCHNSLDNLVNNNVLPCSISTDSSCLLPFPAGEEGVVVGENGIEQLGGARGGERPPPPLPSTSSSNSAAVVGQKYKLVTEGDVQLCKVKHGNNLMDKVIGSKLLRRWETHHIYLNDSCISSKTSMGSLSGVVPYWEMEEVYVCVRLDSKSRYVIRIVLPDGSLLLQGSNAYVRDQWYYSILWKRNIFKYQNLMRSSKRPDVILKELKSLVDFATSSPLQDDCISHVPIEIVSSLLDRAGEVLGRNEAEEVLVALSPLLERSHPPPSLCRYFSRQCRSRPRSPLVTQLFTPVVRRALKHNVDFGKYPQMRRFIQDYIQALNCHNDGLNVTRAFVRRSEFEDWRPSLGQLLQPIPFPEEALSNPIFTRSLSSVIKRIGTDARCEVHQMVLGMRDEKESWFNLFSPSSSGCSDDDGELWGLMLERLLSCCSRRKRFLQQLGGKLLGSCLLLALREHGAAQEALCLLLEWQIVQNDDQVQIAATLQSTRTGRANYLALCGRQLHLKELQSEGGPRKLTLPSRSTDKDLAKLLSCGGSFGNLECLSLAFTQVTSGCAEQLIKLPSLRYLNLWSTQFGDAGLLLISEHLPNLQVLNLCETPVTDKGLLSLTCMTTLRKLNLNSTSLSAQTYSYLRSKMPGLKEVDVRYTDAW